MSVRESSALHDRYGTDTSTWRRRRRTSALTGSGESGSKTYAKREAPELAANVELYTNGDEALDPSEALVHLEKVTAP